MVPSRIEVTPSLMATSIASHSWPKFHWTSDGDGAGTTRGVAGGVAGALAMAARAAARCPRTTSAVERIRVGFPLWRASLNATHASDFDPVSGFPIARTNSSIVACDQSRGVATGEGAVDDGVADDGAGDGAAADDCVADDGAVDGAAAGDGAADDGKVATGGLAGTPAQAAITRQRATHTAASRR
jgi:hypothetical protein